MLKLSLYTRIALSLTVILSAAMLALGYVIVQDTEQKFQQERLQLVTASAKTLAEGSLDALVTGDYELLERWVSSVLLGDFYAYAFLARADGLILTHSNLELVAHHSEPQGQLSSMQIREAVYNGRQVREVVYPAVVGTKHLANAHVGFYPDQAVLDENQNTTRISLLIVFSLLVMLAATLFIIRRHTDPIQRLTDHVAQLSLENDDADLDPRLLKSDDEVGMLSRAFDAMTKRLRMAFDELRLDIKGRIQAEQDRERLIGELEVKNMELERFVYTVSHELKTPLVTISGYAGMLGKDTDEGNTDKLKHDIQRITAAIGIMSALLDDLLELSRIGRVINPPEEVSLDELARDVVDLISQQHVDQDIKIKVLPGLPCVYGDPVRLREVLQSLVENALKFRRGQIQSQVEIGARESGAEVVCHVRDNGIGIAPAYQEKIFGLFERLSAEIEGTGIGLAIAQRIVELHGGRIWIESEGLDKGSTFFFTIPKAR